MQQEKESGKFNLWDTNGRRKDVMNAITTYLSILQTLESEMPDEQWESYPKSLKEYSFYEQALKASSDVFTVHRNYDRFKERIQPYAESFRKKESTFVKDIFPQFKESLDKDIELRARNYTSSLVRLGFATENRELTQAGIEYLSGKTIRDDIEDLLPLSDHNIILLRQISKLRIFTKVKKDSESVGYYSPFFLSLFLLLSDKGVGAKDFCKIILDSSPYHPYDVSYDMLIDGTNDIEDKIEVPEEFEAEGIIDRETFVKHISNNKSSSYLDLYYKFYNALFKFFDNKNDTNYQEIVRLLSGKDRYSLKTAFLKRSKLDIGRKGSYYDLNKFMEKNKDSEWFDDRASFNERFYKEYKISTSIRLSSEYSDTLFRLFSATGVFNFSGALPELLYEGFFKIISEHASLQEKVFGSISREEYMEYEGNGDSYFNRHTTLSEILGLDDSEIKAAVLELHDVYGDEIKESLSAEKRQGMIDHVEAKYPKEKVIELLEDISRRNDDALTRYINSGANVPTIYEYIVTIAWYYISGKDFSLLDSFNLELNGDYEPTHHASGGQGDIEIRYDNGCIILIEVTLMNKQAQKRGEWEPVLRHSINLKADNEDKETTTLFIADELDNNSINIWRAVASVPLESSSSDKMTDRVYIMPFINQEIIDFLKNGTDGKKIIHAVRESFDKIDEDFDKEWRERILKSIVDSET